MGSRRLLSFADALELLGVDPPRIAALDRALGGALNLATGGTSGTVLGMMSERGRIIGLGRDAVRGAGRRLGRAEGRAERTEVLRAAHTVIVVVAWFQALEAADLPISLDDVELSGQEQLALVGASAEDGLVQSLLTAAVPCPAPHEDFVEALDHWYFSLSRRFIAFVTGLAQWELLSETQQQAFRDTLLVARTDEALANYRELYSQLMQTAPEFALWVTENEHRATRAEVRRALDGIDTLLTATARGLTAPVDVAAALARSHEAALGHPVLDTSTAPEGIVVPTLRAMYLDPDFRVAQPRGQSGPADESWWEQFGVRHDLTRYLAGALTGPALAEAPLLVLGQPGAGKSVLTRVLAARLPAAGFLPVRVPLRDVRAEDELQDQIEQAIRAATGERTTWPDLVRAAGGSTPVLLLDGFDELLQTTGVHHTDFLVRVARFQQREAEQGRPVLALVTSRTAVADRTRYPDGMVVLRLEPFRTEQVERWLAIWNDANATTLRPLTWETVSRHAELAAQPLLLTMLALYDATEGGLHREGGEPLAVTELYEELLSSFARREVGKTTRGGVPDHESGERVEQELQRLSLVAFALVNRRRQWVSAAELDEDLAALLGRRAAEASGFRTPLGAAEVALGRFFFVQRAQSVRDGQTLSTYEFLHATFGEYLVVRLALRLLTDLLTPRPSLSLGESRIDDDLTYALLSYASLASRQMLRFARGLVRPMDAAERERLAARLIRVLHEHETRTADHHPGYRPAGMATATRHGLYGSNLVLMAMVLVGRTTAAELFPKSSDPVSDWSRSCQLWRSSMDEQQWTDFALAFTTRRRWDADGHRVLEISLREGEVLAPERVDPNWLFRNPEGHGGSAWQRTYWDDLWHKMSLTGATNDSVVRHAMDPVFRNLGPAVTTFVAEAGAPATSLAHDLLRLLMEDISMVPGGELATLYVRVLDGIRMLPRRFAALDRIMDMLLTARDRDRARLPTPVAERVDDFVRGLAADLDDDSPLHELTRLRMRRVVERHYPGLLST
ncbi:NACHT domain-containing protein [Streptomyces sp. YJ-C3]